ncbi:MAG: hypothetical protein GY896_22870 [Gammaproteobacteria bacterium]|nr:hypothetical protein [Gammaproteobacteria bacterium]
MKKKPIRKKGRKPGPKAHKKRTRAPAKKKPPRRKLSTKQLPEQDVDFETLLGELLPRQKEFLEAYYEEGTVAEAARKTGVSRQAHHDVWMRKDSAGKYVYGLYAQLFNDARNALVEIAEAALWKRGVKGIDEPLFYQGEMTKHKITKYDTTALIFWLKGNCPQKYRDRFEHTGRDGGPISMTIDAARQIADNFDKNQKEGT